MTQRVVNYTYGTGNPVLPDGSIDVRDGIDNLQSFDIFMNAPEDTYNQRDGEIVSTIAGANNRFNAQILNMGFTRIGTFAAGATITNPRQTLLWDVADGGDGQEYGWSGAFPKVVPVTSTPASTGGISVGAWISRFDPELRVQVREVQRRSYAEAGYNLVAGSFEAGGVLVNANDALLQESTGKAFSGPAGTVAAGTNPTSGGFVDVSAVLGRRYVKPEDFANLVVGNDWTQAIIAAIKSLNDYPETTTNTSDLIAVRNSGGGVIKLDLKKIYVTTETIFIPSGVSIQGAYSYFNSAIEGGFIDYQGPSNTPAVATLIYKNNGGVYTKYSDINNLPTGPEFDDGTYFNCAARADIACAILTKKGTEVGAFFAGAGVTTTRMSIGENAGVNSRCPDVGFVQAASWGTKHHEPRVLAWKQFAHFFGANSGSVVDTPYMARPTGSSGSELDVAKYQVASATGCYGVSAVDTNITILNPVIEHAFNMFPMSNSVVNITQPRVESFNSNVKHVFYCANNSSLNSWGTMLYSKASDPNSSCIYLENQTVGRCAVKMIGSMESDLGFKLVLGTNSGPVVEISDIPIAQMQFGEVGDHSLMSSYGSAIGRSVVYVDATSGDDSYYGLHPDRKMRTLQAAITVAGFYAQSKEIEDALITINVSGVVAATSDINIKYPRLAITGTGSVNLGSFKLLYGAGQHSLRNSIPIVATGSSAISLSSGCSLDLYMSNHIKGSYAVAKYDGLAKMTILAEGSCNFAGLTAYADATDKTKPCGIVEGCINLPVALCATLPSAAPANRMVQDSFINGY